MSKLLPYGRQAIDEQDIAAVADALRGELITQGPRVEAFERAFARTTGASHAIAFSSGTAALHGAAAAADIHAGDHALTTAVSFVASSNCVLYHGARPLFADIDPNTLNLDCAAATADGANSHVKAVIAVSLAGLPIDLAPLQPLRQRGVTVIEDAAHALGAVRAQRPVGGDGQADMTVFSLHPVKAMTTGEGGVVTTADPLLASKLRAFRTHGITRAPDLDGRAQTLSDPLHGSWHYDVESLGFNYRITDFQCALGLSQLRKLRGFIAQRNQIAAHYRELLADVDGLLLPPAAPLDGRHAYHLFVVRFEEGAVRRRMMFDGLRAAGVGTQLHYIPIYRHKLYRSLGFGDHQSRLPHTERYYASALSLPIFPGMTEHDTEHVARQLRRLLAEPLITSNPDQLEHAPHA